MVKFRLISSVAVALLSIAGVAPAQAASIDAAPSFDFDTKGLIVQYEPGVAPLAADGQPTGENTAAADLLAGRDLAGKRLRGLPGEIGRAHV